MSVDTSIYNNLLRPPKSVAELDAEAMGNQQNRLALRSTQMQMDAAQRGVERGNRLTSMLGGFKPGMSTADQGDALTRGGFLDEARKVVESGAKANKDQREAEKFQFEQAREQIGFVNQIIGSAKDQATYSQGRQAMAARGMDVSQIPEQFDPAYVASAGEQTLTQLQRIEQGWKAKGFDLDVQKFEADTSHKKATLAETARGHTLTANSAAASRAQSDRHHRDNQSTAMSKPFEVTDSNGNPVLVRQDKQGRIAEVEGYSPKRVEKPLNDSQSKALLFGTRMQEADKALASLAQEGTTNSVPGSRMPGIGGAITALSSNNRQMLDQAKRDFMTATLRRESGAAISSGEYDNADKQYFPQIGDSDGVMAQKARNRALAIKGVLVEVPEKHRTSITPNAAPPAKPEAAAPAGQSQAYKDAEKERRYQEFKAKQGQK